ncbi:MAG: Sensor histidine kinase TodS [Candidatus Dichloromethanomonas elyunquensis]|nr:MAG: Sensor histidine kinase TodS [Candidatus Dichloromethanomonas elyunquensis]
MKMKQSCKYKYAHNDSLEQEVNLLNQSKEAFSAWDLNGPIIYCNKGAEKLYGYTSVQLQEKINWEKRRFEILLEVGRKLLSSNDPQKLVEELCSNVMEFLDCHIFFNYLADEEQQRLHLKACAGIPEEAALEIEWLDYSTVAGDIQTDFAKSFGIKACVCHPLIEHNKIIGTLLFGTRSKDIFHEDEIALIKAVADQVAAAMNRIRMEELVRTQQELIIQTEKNKTEAFLREIKMKDEFLSLISHEFRTPLTVINSAIQAMEMLCQDELSDKGKGFLNKIRHNANRELKLINNLLDITRINAGQMKMNQTNIDIVQYSKSITESVTVYAEQKHIPLSFSSTIRTKVIAIDEKKYERILLNLLSNAIKFTPGGKAVSVLVSQNVLKGNNAVCIQVKDEGPGIPKQKMDLIFELFGQVDTSLTREAEGSGTGLSLVKMFVEMMSGEVFLESEAGEGSVFTILLPDETIIEPPSRQTMEERPDQRLIRAAALEFSDI